MHQSQEVTDFTLYYLAVGRRSELREQKCHLDHLTPFISQGRVVIRVASTGLSGIQMWETSRHSSPLTISPLTFRLLRENTVVSASRLHRQALSRTSFTPLVSQALFTLVGT